MLNELRLIVDNCFLGLLRFVDKRIVTAMYRFDWDFDLVCLIWLVVPEYVRRYKMVNSVVRPGT